MFMYVKTVWSEKCTCTITQLVVHMCKYNSQHSDHNMYENGVIVGCV